MKRLTRRKRPQGFAGVPAQRVTPRDHRRFLVEAANLADLQERDDAAQKAWSRFAKKCEPWLVSLQTLSQGVSIEKGTMNSVAAMRATIFSGAFNNRLAGAAYSVSQTLREAWSKPTAQDRERIILVALIDLGQVYGANTGSRYALAQGPIGQALLEAIHSADLMRVCMNPECPARYFIAYRRTQKFCSEKCAGPGQREAKRRWWNENRAGKKLSRRKSAERGGKPGNKRRAKPKK